MATLTKADIIEIVLNRVDGVERQDAKVIIEEIFEEIRSTLESGEHVRLSGFGNFILRDKKARPGRNPKTGEEVDIVARRVVTFKAGKKLRDRVENSTPNN